MTPQEEAILNGKRTNARLSVIAALCADKNQKITPAEELEDDLFWILGLPKSEWRSIVLDAVCELTERGTMVSDTIHIMDSPSPAEALRHVREMLSSNGNEERVAALAIASRMRRQGTSL